jgi:hypothetical protein
MREVEFRLGKMYLGSVDLDSRCPAIRQGIPLCKKVAGAVRGAFRALKRAATFPMRFVGAKDWSVVGVCARAVSAAARRIFTGRGPENLSDYLFGTGYQRRATTLKAEQTKSFLPYASACAAVQVGEHRWVTPFGYEVISADLLGEPEVSEHRPYFFDPETGLKALVLRKGNEVVISFGAFNSHKDIVESSEERKISWKHRYGAFGSCLGFKPEIYGKAVQWVKRVMESRTLEGTKVVLSGSCFGGSIAQYSALKLGLQGVCFNSFPIGPGLQHDIGTERLAEAESYVQLLSCQKDFVSDHRFLGGLDRLSLSSMGVKTAGNFGQRNQIPSPYKDGGENHRYFLGAMFHQLNGNIRTKPWELDSDDPLLNQVSKPWQV